MTADKCLSLLDDEPTLEDLLGREDQVWEVGEMIAACEPPQVFGVYGDWGSGKTSFLKQLDRYLTGGDDIHGKEVRGKHENRVTTVWFEAWRYQYESAPVVALLQEIRSQLPWQSKAFQEAQKLGEVTLRSALLAVEDLTKKIGIQASAIQKEGERWERDNFAAALPSHVIRQHLEKALSTLLGSTKRRKRRLVILVDDLDRCESSAAFALLEGIKIYLNLPSCIFVLGVNQRIIEDAIAAQIPSYQKEQDRGPRRRAREYLEKLCHNPVHLRVLPSPGALLGELLRGLPRLEVLCAVVNQFDCLPKNARRIKGFANLLRRCSVSVAQRLEVPASGSVTREAQLIVLMTYLYRFHPEIYRMLDAYPKFAEKLVLWCENPAQEGLHPSLQGIQTPDMAGARNDAAETPEPTGQLLPQYPDPSDSHVFWAQKLVVALATITSTEIQRHRVG